MRVFQRYIVLQVPGWLLAAVVVYALERWAGLDRRIALALWLAYLAKDFILFPFLRRAYETDSTTGAASLVGESGTATEDLAPEGYIRIRGELWHAQLVPGASGVPAGTRVRVRAARGLTLTVTPD